jgi:HD-GYP domain-containing protein (c-di-GMP phosphodiesterase class II)
VVTRVRREELEGGLRLHVLGHPRGGQLWREATAGADFARALAPSAGADPEEAYLAALARDVGKLLWPAWLFERPLRPDEDRRVLHGHVLDGVGVLSRVPGWGGLDGVLAAVGQHHERWDGTGYPGGLRGEEICLLGRVVAVADALAAMTRPRPWAAALSLERARSEVAVHAGSQFDPAAARWVEALEVTV